jgi:hypothetical protein
MAEETKNKKSEVATFSSRKMLLENAEKETVIKYSDRLKVEIVKETKHYKVGMITSPHRIKGEALIKQGIAKEYVEPKKTK